MNGQGLWLPQGRANELACGRSIEFENPDEVLLVPDVKPDLARIFGLGRLCAMSHDSPPAKLEEAIIGILVGNKKGSFAGINRLDLYYRGSDPRYTLEGGNPANYFLATNMLGFAGDPILDIVCALNPRVYVQTVTIVGEVGRDVSEKFPADIQERGVYQHCRMRLGQ